LEEDRQLSPGTVADYLRYLRKLDSKVVSYDLYLEISSNKWFIKIVRLYLDYLYKKGELLWRKLQKLKSIFKVRKTTIDSQKIDEEELVLTLYAERAVESEILAFKLLLYTGARFSEIIKLINEFDETKLECFENHCRYAMFWSRGRKRCDWIFLPKHLATEIQKHKGYYRGKKIHSISRYYEKKYDMDLKLFRKLFYHICRQVIDKEVCDFVKSRISRISIGDIRYDDLLERSDKDYPRIVERINRIIDEILESMSDGIPIQRVEGYSESEDEKLKVKADNK